jgi:hypothetical protein
MLNHYFKHIAVKRHFKKKECELISPTNLVISYYHECFVCGIVKTPNCLQNLISKCGEKNLYDDEKQNQIYNKLLEKHHFENS